MSDGFLSRADGLPDVVRAALKDEHERGELAGLVKDAWAAVLGNRHLARHGTQLTRLAADLLYYGATTLGGRQTLGEEYCGLVQSVPSATRLAASPDARPTPLPAAVGASRRAALVLLGVLLPHAAALPAVRTALWRAVDAAVASIENEDVRALVRRVAELAATAASVVVENVNVLYRAHVVLFYLGGPYYELSKRMLGIRYVFGRRRGAGERRAPYPVLGWMIVVQLGLTLALHLRRLSARRRLRLHERARAEKDRGSGDANPFAYDLHHTGLRVGDGSAGETVTTRAEDALVAFMTRETVPEGHAADDSASAPVPASHSGRKCTLCLGPRRDPAATPCGHIFCWSCIASWAVTKSECPLCRQPFQAKRLIAIQHYDVPHPE